MSIVKSRKQHEMKVVPHRPILSAGVVGSLVLAAVGFVWLAFELGLGRGLDLKEQVLVENELIKDELIQRDTDIAKLRRQLADIELGGVIDSQATAEVREEIESLKTQVAELNEEIRFYKGVMLPKVGEKGLRIERLDIKTTAKSNRVKYSLLLTQVVDKPSFVRGGVEIKLVGNQGEEPKEISLGELTGGNKKIIGFNFRYFQNLDGELIIPAGFTPREVMVIAKSSGGRSQKRERKFDWTLEG